jgi:hypothetical protein
VLLFGVLCNKIGEYRSGAKKQNRMVDVNTVFDT